MVTIFRLDKMLNIALFVTHDWRKEFATWDREVRVKGVKKEDTTLATWHDDFTFGGLEKQIAISKNDCENILKRISRTPVSDFLEYRIQVLEELLEETIKRNPADYARYNSNVLARERRREALAEKAKQEEYRKAKEEFGNMLKE